MMSSSLRQLRRATWAAPVAQSHPVARRSASESGEPRADWLSRTRYRSSGLRGLFFFAGVRT